MKIKSHVWIIILLLVLALSGCQANQAEPAEGETVYLPQSSSGSNNQGYPAQEEANPQNDDAYPVQNEPVSDVEVAYPVSSADLQLLNRDWFLYAYQKDSAVIDPVTKTITFSGDAFKITIEGETTTGKWSARIDSPNPILVLDTENGETLFYEIITLNETNLTLRTAENQEQIVEEYLPVD